ncbi:nucleoside triphosphate pyrophosphohydrolase ham1 [Aspergillus niger]|nr:nucleoside triphosphate pyrophosphohydrolase ham1 [Aspergillus niger]GLA43850.1 nucleoside triphosphate pyrophosphohydrolase ham1 [Aspergillus niger]
MASLKNLNFITGNKNKLAEVKAILGTVIDVENQAVDLPEIQGTIEEIAREKCRRAAEVTHLGQVGGPVLTEDTALEFHALKGLPGPYIKSFLDALGHEGLNKLLDSFETRAAEAVCTFAFSSGPGSDPILFQGRTELLPGWDPIFEHQGKTYAEMDKEEKVMKLSHQFLRSATNIGAEPYLTQI